MSTELMEKEKKKKDLTKQVRDELSKFCSANSIPYEYEYAIWQKYKVSSIYNLKTNPYILAYMDGNLTLEDIDKIALNLGFDAKDDNRLKAYFLYALKDNLELNSSTGCETQKLMQSFFKLSGVKDSSVYHYILDQLVADCRIIVDFNDVYLIEMYEIEKEIADFLSRWSKRFIHRKYPYSIFETAINSFSFKLNNDQLNAIKHSLCNYLTVISGSAGGGKSTITKAIVDILKASDEKVILLSPTGKAAKRLEECTGCEAKTIHRFIEASKDTELIDTEVPKVPYNTTIIIDEISMVDIVLFKKIIEACQDDTRLILVGDAQQLPSVKAGDVLADIIKSNTIEISYLTDVKRQAEDSNIIKYCNKVNKGEIFKAPIREKDFFYIVSKERSTVMQNLIRAYKKCIELEGLMETQVITPYKKGELGAWNLNVVLKELINPIVSDGKKLRSAFDFTIGDKVRHIKNNYKKNIFNGEVGIVHNIRKLGGKTYVDVAYDGIVSYTEDDINELQLAYASTIHASQGSEYKNVIVVLDNEVSNLLLVRKLLYTALSRARIRCILLSTGNCVSQAIKDNNYKKRITKLCDFLQEDGNDDLFN